ncbi:hypothetical protein CHS0354_000195 [Potamilus streckersoni]|uniref:Uncharacterized protein n=1 Tax=Potamilus streckersoni TaxID=2493646 RepID=A0AAE0SQB1_9BIVA|nr:hypothetical protein CHS0354_000195 [Potamilus streckersoni]
MRPNVSRQIATSKRLTQAEVKSINRICTGKTHLQTSFGKLLKDKAQKQTTLIYCQTPETLSDILNDCSHYQRKHANILTTHRIANNTPGLPQRQMEPKPGTHASSTH